MSTKSFILTVSAILVKATCFSIFQTNQLITFKENKGQIHDQNFNRRSDILFNGTAGAMNFYLRPNGISYQLTKVNSWKSVESPRSKELIKEIDNYSIYRIDLNWINANSHSTITKGAVIDGYDNYYDGSNSNGILNVQSFADITYNNIYEGINLHWYQKNNTLEYDFIVSPHSDYSAIKIKIEGATQLSINEKGELVIATPFGDIIEGAPSVYQGKKRIQAMWLLENQTISFKVGNYDKNLPLIIDPVIRNWGTYYGGSSPDYIYGSTVDNTGNIYITGNSASSNVLATVGSHQTNIVGGPISAILTKFNSSGVRQWGTYYGGAGANYGQGCVTSSGDVYMCGYTTATTGISTPLSHQAAHAGSEDGFLVKFNPFGVRTWATYYGGAGSDKIFGCCADANGNVFACGSSQNSTGTVVATIGSHQSAMGSIVDAFVVKFNAAGTRQWGTYYGGTGNSETAFACATDNSNNLFLVGETTTPTSTMIASLGSHQTAFGGIGDGFIAKFNPSGVRQWGTYYGGTNADQPKSCVVDASGNIIICGLTLSTTGTLVATPSSHQPNFGSGTSDGFVAKFSTSGVRQWGTYYGGAVSDDLNAITTDAANNLYVVGNSNSSNAISTPNSYQPTLNGQDDVILVKFDQAGVRQWGTYYGGNGYDYGQTIFYRNGNLNFGGYTGTASSTNIATPSSHQPTFAAGVYDGFYAQLFECNNPSAPIDLTSASNLTMCAQTGTTTLSASGSGTISWYNVSTGGTSLGTGSVFVTSTLSAGMHTIYAEDQTCTVSINRTPITVTVFALPTVSITATSTIFCIGQNQSATLTANGATSYSWSNASTNSVVIVTPTVTTNYTVVGTSSAGCTNTTTVSLVLDPCTVQEDVYSESQMSVFLYPNPADVYTEIESGIDAKIQILNVLGQQVIESYITKGKNKLVIEELPKGMYYISITHGNKKETLKLVKQ